MYKKETMLELYGIEEFPETKFPLSLNIIDRYQRGYPFLTEKLKCAEYKKISFHVDQNTI